MKYHRDRRWILTAWRHRMIGNSWVNAVLLVSGDISARVSQNAGRWIIKQNENIYYHQIKAHKVSQKMLKFIGWGKLSNVCSRQTIFLTRSQQWPDSKVHGANMGPTWDLSAPDGPHVGPTNLAIGVILWETLVQEVGATRNQVWRVRSKQSGLFTTHALIGRRRNQIKIDSMLLDWKALINECCELHYGIHHKIAWLGLKNCLLSDQLQMYFLIAVLCFT